MQVVSYDLEFDIDFLKSTLKGEEEVVVRGGTDPLVLDSAEHRVLEVTVDGRPAGFEVDRKGRKLVVHGVGQKKSVVRIKFTKEISDESIFGLYKSKYGKDHLLVTDLEPVEARTVFPCKDDPSYKAVFRLRVVTDSDLRVISNAPLVSKRKVGASRSMFTFEQTPKMSTYLFFLGVGKFQEAEVKKDGVRVVSAFREGQEGDARYVLEYSARILSRLGEYYGIPYPLPKLHLIGLPEYHTGAMENWGAITFREPYVILPPKASARARQAAVHISAHEIAHQWFGDLVTMKWWDDIWLNEAFATFMDNKVMDMLAPEWDSWGEFISRRMLDALNTDSLSGTHPIHVDVKSDHDLSGIFDAISYSKGASVLRMLEAYVGEKAFRKGVSSYLKKFSEANARGEDLWKSIEDASSLPVAKVAKAWTTKPGFPYVRVERVGGGAKLTQSRLLLSGKRDDALWPVPVEVMAGGKPTKLLLEGRSETVAIGKGRLLVNPGRKGFYSVLYDASLYESLAEGFGELHPHDASGVLSDLYLFMQAGLADPELYFRFVKLSMKSEASLLPRVLAGQLSYLWSIANESEAVREACVGLAGAQMRRIGQEARKGEGEETSILRERVSVLLARTDPGYAEKLSARFADFSSVQSDLREAVAVSYASAGGAKEYRKMAALAGKTQNEIDRGYLLVGMTAARDLSLVEEALDRSLFEPVARSDLAYTVRGAASNPEARRTLWDWLVKRYDKFREVYGGSQQFYLYTDDVIPRCAVGLEPEVRRFISGKRYEEGRLTYRRTFEVLAVNSALRKRLLKL